MMDTLAVGVALAASVLASLPARKGSMTQTDRTRSRMVAVVWCITFAISTAFPVLASVLRLPALPRWIGISDVCIAAILLIGAVWLYRLPGKHVNPESRNLAYACNRIILKVPLVLLGAFFVFGSRVDWTVLLCGLAWRAWLLSEIAPQLVASFRNGAKEDS